jgi:hypothetical protein
MKMEQTECSETSEYKIQTPGNYPEENVQHTEHGESWNKKSNVIFIYVLTRNVAGNIIKLIASVCRPLRFQFYA